MKLSEASQKLCPLQFKDPYNTEKECVADSCMWWHSYGKNGDKDEFGDCCIAVIPYNLYLIFEEIRRPHNLKRDV